MPTSMQIMTFTDVCPHPVAYLAKSLGLRLQHNGHWDSQTSATTVKGWGALAAFFPALKSPLRTASTHCMSMKTCKAPCMLYGAANRSVRRWGCCSRFAACHHPCADAPPCHPDAACPPENMSWHCVTRSRSLGLVLPSSQAAAATVRDAPADSPIVSGRPGCARNVSTTAPGRHYAPFRHPQRCSGTWCWARCPHALPPASERPSA